MGGLHEIGGGIGDLGGGELANEGSSTEANFEGDTIVADGQPHTVTSPTGVNFVFIVHLGATQEQIDAAVNVALNYADAVNNGDLSSQTTWSTLQVTIAPQVLASNGTAAAGIWRGDTNNDGAGELEIAIFDTSGSHYSGANIEQIAVHELTHGYNPDLHLHVQDSPTNTTNPSWSHHSQEWYDQADAAFEALGIPEVWGGGGHDNAVGAPPAIDGVSPLINQSTGAIAFEANDSGNEGNENDEGDEGDEGDEFNFFGGFSFGKPIVIDLDGDGVEIDTLDQSTAMFDFDEDGFREKTAWVSKDDGLLMVDLGNDGQLTESKEIAFANFTEDASDTDLEALREVFDTNGDDVLNALDDDWELFKVWQDANQNGILDDGELMTLDEVGITEISLIVRDGTGEVYSDGTTNHGLIDVTLEDGSIIDGGDIGFASESEGVRETTDADGNTVIEYEGGEPGTGELAEKSFVFGDDGQLVHHIQALGMADTVLGSMEFAVQDGDNVSFVRDGTTLLTIQGVTVDDLVQSLLDDPGEDDAPLVAYDGDTFDFEDTEDAPSTNATASALTAQAVANGETTNAEQSDATVAELADDVTDDVVTTTPDDVA